MTGEQAIDLLAWVVVFVLTLVTLNLLYRGRP